jgi:hypothetical protein
VANISNFIDMMLKQFKYAAAFCGSDGNHSNNTDRESERE